MRLRALVGRVITATFSRDRIRESWKLEAVARQQKLLVEKQLQMPETVPPYRTFLQIAGDVADTEPSCRKFLDLGCGVGHYSELLTRYFPGRFDYTGADYSPSMIDSARQLWTEHSTFVVDDIMQTRLDLRSFDILFASALVDVVDDFRAVLRVLFAGTARLLILHRQRLTQGESYSEIVRGYSGQRTFETHLNPNDLKTLLQANGLRIRKEYPVEGSIFSFLIVRG